MSPVIHAKRTFVTFDVDCFSDLGVVIFYHVESLTFSFHRTDLGFDQYFEQSLKENTRKDREMGSRFVFTGNTKLPNKLAEDFLMNSTDKNYFNEFHKKSHKSWASLWWRCFYHKIPVWETQPTADTSYITLSWPTNIQADGCLNYWNWCSQFSDIMFRRFHIL